MEGDMLMQSLAGSSAAGTQRAMAMREELSTALLEALSELDLLPESADGALIGLYAVMADLEKAIRRTEAMDQPLRLLRA
jgi:hypothetical protein